MLRAFLDSACDELLPERFRRIELLATELGVRDRVMFTGQVSPAQLDRQFVACDAFVLPAIEDAKGDVEGLGVVLIEALSHGRPVIATDVGGFGETLADTDAGLLVPPRDPVVLAATIAALLLDDELRAGLAANAATAAAGELSWDRSAERHEVVYTQVTA